MKSEKLRVKSSERGITLIALVITIVVMLILAGVTINLTLGENGIFTTAQKAAGNYTDSQNKELSYLEAFTNEVNNIVNPAPLGTIIKIENNINYTADGAGNTIPVPVGFNPITTVEGQGTKLTGFVIRDISVDSEGNPTETNGNEFVWVPVEGMSYTYNRYAFLEKQPEWELDTDTESMKIKYSITKDDYFIERMPKDEEISVKTFGGYYIGRYESGVENYDKDNITKSNGLITDTDLKENWTGYKAEDEKKLKIVVKRDKQVWNYITRNKAETISKELYNKKENNVVSKLCSSYAWDTALKFIETKNSSYLINSMGGNYKTVSDEVKPTGYHVVNNIYDMGGNTAEWTTEFCNYQDYPCVGRGGSYFDSALEGPASYRYRSKITDAHASVSFRVALFM